MNKETLMPLIRFSGFTGTWENNKLGDLGSVAMCKRIFKEQTSENGDIPFFKIGTFGKKADAFIPRAIFEEYKEKYSFPELGDILISASGTIGRAVVYKGEDSYFQDSNIIWFKRDKKLINNSFLKQFYEIVKWAGLEGSTIKRLYNSNILSTKINLPKLEEQTKIGEFFEQLDKIITLQQQLLNDHKHLKKAMLQKMFPQKGETVPRVRFASFNDVWEKHRLGEYFDKYQNTIYLEDETRYKQITVKNTGLIEFRDTKFGKNIGRKRQYVIDTENYPNTLTFTRQTIYEGGIGFVPNILNGAIVTENMPLLNMKKTLLKTFIIAVLKSPSYYKNVIERNMPIGSAQKALHEKDWLNSYLLIPNIKEQEKIGNFFKQLDETIVLYEQKLETYQTLKKAMLQKMFV